MNREEFLRQLESLLMTIPENDRLDAIAYYNDYFDEAGVENEQQVIEELGSPQKVAANIKENLGATESRAYSDPGVGTSGGSYEYQGSAYTQGNYQTQYGQTQYSQPQQKKDIPWVLIIVIAVLTFPLWIGLVAGLFGLLIGLIAGTFGLLVGLGGASFGLCVGGIVCFVVGILRLAVGPAEGVITIAAGAILLVVGLLLLLLFAWLAFKWIPALVKAIINGCKGLTHRNEGGNQI